MNKFLVFVTVLLFGFSTRLEAQNIYTFAGDGTATPGGSPGAGGDALSAKLWTPTDIAQDRWGNTYIVADFRVLKITAVTGVVSVVAGTGIMGFSGDGRAAVLAQIYPTKIAVSPDGDIYIADYGNDRIRKVTAATGIITTIAGTGADGFSGDGGLASAATLNSPWDVALDVSGNIYIADSDNNRIRKVTASTGIITTVAGNGASGFSGDEGTATSCSFHWPYSIAVDLSGNIYIAERNSNRIRKVTASTGIITTIAGNGSYGFSGDNNPATVASMAFPQAVEVDNEGNVYFSSVVNNRIRKVSAKTGNVTTIAGTGTYGFSGDGGLATAANLNSPQGIFVDNDQNVYFADAGNLRIRFICNNTSVSPPVVISPVTLCKDSPAKPLSATGSYLKWYTSPAGGVGSTVAPIPSVSAVGSTTYYVSQTTPCGESSRTALVIDVLDLPNTPKVKSPLTFCAGKAAAALTAEGTALRWYTTATGGSGSSVPPIPATELPGIINYYVSERFGSCESVRASITVITDPSPSIPVVTDLRYCKDAPADILTAMGVNLRWYDNAVGGLEFPSAPVPATNLESSTDYFVTQTNSFNCTSPRAKLKVQVMVKPDARVTSVTDPKFFICPGSTITLKAIVLPYGIDFQWQSVRTDIPGANADSFVASHDGEYRLIVSNAPGCADTVSVWVEQDNSELKTGISPTDIWICNGVQIKLFAESTIGKGLKYAWLKDGLPISDTTAIITVGAKGIYELKITNGSGCWALSNASFVSTYPDVIKPSVSRSGSKLFVPASYDRYQWYRNNKVIHGANFSFYHLLFEGNYSVVVWDKNGCSTISDTVGAVALSLNTAIADGGYKIYPNPTTGKINVVANRDLTIEVLDILGRAILQTNNSATIDLSAYADNFYLLRIIDKEGKLIGIERVSKLSK